MGWLRVIEEREGRGGSEAHQTNVQLRIELEACFSPALEGRGV